MLVGLLILAACMRAEPHVQVATDLNALRLTDLWTTVAEERDIREETAVLESLHLSATADAALQGVRFSVHALTEDGRNQVFFVDVNSTGDLTWRQQQVQPGNYPLHPAELLGSLDEVDLAGLAAAKGGLTVLVDSIAGDVSYRQAHTDIYLLGEGRFRPIREIAFRSETPWATITACAPSPDEAPEIAESALTAPDGSAATTRTVSVGAANQCELWFLEQTAARAVVLDLVGSGEQDR